MAIEIHKVTSEIGIAKQTIEILNSGVLPRLQCRQLLEERTLLLDNRHTDLGIDLSIEDERQIEQFVNRNRRIEVDRRVVELW